MRWNRQMGDEYLAIHDKVISLQVQVTSNYPESLENILKLHTVELTGYKRRLEEMIELTTFKEWFYLLGFIDQTRQ